MDVDGIDSETYKRIFKYFGACPRFSSNRKGFEILVVDSQDRILFATKITREFVHNQMIKSKNRRRTMKTYREYLIKLFGEYIFNTGWHPPCGYVIHDGIAFSNATEFIDKNYDFYGLTIPQIMMKLDISGC